MHDRLSSKARAVLHVKRRDVQHSPGVRTRTVSREKPYDMRRPDNGAPLNTTEEIKKGEKLERCVEENTTTYYSPYVTFPTKFFDEKRKEKYRSEIFFDTSGKRDNS
ncbi:hypothetical protein HZH66_006072 [Vespula vulgaris]|uniref:Uncharacterized protein n=1 Tax=Vespula vulgaris TaxID=7454 RepID=A0A834K6B9_VESVU|nr:hypothetical protein HZH66_006072 [Vespula vulgaris]